MKPQPCPCCGQSLPVSRDLIIDPAGFVVRWGQVVALTGLEAALFDLLHDAKGRVISKEALMAGLYWSSDRDPDIKILDVMVCKLRRKLKPLGVEIQTVHSRGYRMTPQIQQEAA